MRNELKHWSFSMLMTYEECPLRAKYQYVEHQPQLPLAADSPMMRGQREHQRLENFVRGDAGALDKAECRCTAEFKPILEHARDLFANQQATVEVDWFFDDAWQPCSKDARNSWSKIDLSVLAPEQGFVVSVDYKSGRSNYNTVKHVQQNQLYAAHTACMYEWADSIHTELWYLDEGSVRTAVYSREAALKYVGRFQQRADRMLNEQYWRPHPSIVNCKYCPFGPRGTGICPVGV